MSDTQVYKGEVMTKFSFEVPLKHLEDFHDEQDFIFALSFLFGNPRYDHYIHNQDKELWIDNSYNETKEPGDVEYLAELADIFTPNILIAPDTAEWNHQKMQDEYLNLRIISGLDDSRLSIIIHHPDWIGYYKSWGIKNFCIPYDYRYCTLEKLRRFSECHFLGLVSINEILYSNPPSCDTSMPIKLSLIKWDLDKWIKEGCPHIHTSKTFFDCVLTQKELLLAKSNIRRLKELCQEKSSS